MGFGHASIPRTVGGGFSSFRQPSFQGLDSDGLSALDDGSDFSVWPRTGGSLVLNNLHTTPGSACRHVGFSAGYGAKDRKKFCNDVSKKGCCSPKKAPVRCRFPDEPARRQKNAP